MARTINKVELLGRVGTDPEMSYTPGGTAVTKLRLATDRYRKEGDDETDWHNIVCWGNTAEAVNEYVGKGQRVYVAGRLVQNSWESETTASDATAPRFTPQRSCSSTRGTATGTETPGRQTTPLPSSLPPYSRTPTPSRRRDTRPLPFHGGAASLRFPNHRRRRLT